MKKGTVALCVAVGPHESLGKVSLYSMGVSGHQRKTYTCRFVDSRRVKEYMRPKVILIAVLIFPLFPCVFSLFLDMIWVSIG